MDRAGSLSVPSPNDDEAEISHQPETPNHRPQPDRNGSASPSLIDDYDDASVVIGGSELADSRTCSQKRLYNFSMPLCIESGSSSKPDRLCGRPKPEEVHSDDEIDQDTLSPTVSPTPSAFSDGETTAHHFHHHGLRHDRLRFNDATLSLSAEHTRFKKHVIDPRTDAIRRSLRNYVNEQSTDLLPKMKGDVIILGGYRGSTLRDATSHRQMWIPMKVTLGLRRVNLGLGLSDEDELEARNTVYPDGMLDKVGPIDISRPLIKGLEERGGGDCHVHSWGYDWRLSLDISGKQLYEKLLELAEARDSSDEDAARGTLIIAHSMGGMVAQHAVHLAMEQGRQDVIRGVVFVGCPYGCPQILSPLRFGDSVLMAKDLLTAKVNFSMRCSFSFLPLNGKCFVNDIDPTLEYPIDMFNPQHWMDYHLSPCVAIDEPFRSTQTGDDPFSSDLSHAEAMEYLKAQLPKAKKFLTDLQRRFPASEYPTMSVVYSSAIPTARGVLVPSREAIKYTKFENLLYGAGDGVVHRQSLFPIIAGYDDCDIDVFQSDYGHVSLCSDLHAVGDAIASILAKEGKNYDDLFATSQKTAAMLLKPLSPLMTGPAALVKLIPGNSAHGTPKEPSPTSSKPTSTSSLSPSTSSTRRSFDPIRLSRSKSTLVSNNTDRGAPRRAVSSGSSSSSPILRDRARTRTSTRADLDHTDEATLSSDLQRGRSFTDKSFHDIEHQVWTSLNESLSDIAHWVSKQRFRSFHHKHKRTTVP